MYSVVIPLYNKEKSIFSTVQSVLNQSYKNFELIIVNDGSTDNSLNIVKNLNDERIKIIDKPNGGVSSARNAGIINAHNEYIAFLDGDDIWFPNHLEVINSLISNFNDNDIVGYTTKFIKSKNKNISVIKQDASQYIIKNYVKEVTKRRGIISSSNFVIKRSKIIENILYDESLSYGEDIEFWYRTFKNASLVASNIITTIYNLGAENRSVVKIHPLEKNFHIFKYSNATKEHRQYFDKLVSILILGYSIQKAYKIAFKVLWMYKARIFFILSYYLKLIFMKIIKTFMN